MKIRTKLTLLAAAAAMVWLPLQAAAAYETEAYIPAAIRLEGFDRGEFAVELTALEGAPAPKEYILRRSGEGKLLFGPIRYTAPGIYLYHVEQDPGSDGSIEYDTAQYEAIVYVENSKENGLVAQVSAVKLNAGEGGKAEKADIVFTNRKKDSGGEDGGDDSLEETVQQEQETAAAAVPMAAEAAAPRTGDASRLASWLCLLSGAAAGLAIVRRGKQK